MHGIVKLLNHDNQIKPMNKFYKRFKKHMINDK